MPALLRLLLPLTGALALILTAPPARAADPPADGAAVQEEPADPADTNGDGVVSRRERRRYRRASRGRASGDRTAAGAGADAEAEAADAAAERSAATMSKASGAAAALKSSLASPDAAGAAPRGAPGGSAAAEQAAKPGLPAPGTHDPADPKTVADFALAARSGYAPAFAGAGLKLSADGRSIVRLDGSPADAQDLARLRSGILSLPAALARRPDFFSHVSPERYADLKREYRAQPRLADTVYKHVATTAADRDFVRSDSCEKLSAACNPSAESSYRKGDLVPPEDLDRMWEALQKDLDAPDAASGMGASSGPRAVHAACAARTPEDGAQTPAEREGPAASGGAAAASGAPAPAGTAAAVVRRAWRAARAVLGPDPGATARRAALPAAGLLGAGLLAASALVLRRR